MRRKIS
jgi:hypothetical protein